MALHPDREGRLTASMHGQALGYGYDSPAKSWRRWHGLEDFDERAKSRMDYGIAHEADALSALEAACGFIIDRTGDDQLWTPYEDWSGCTTDGLIDDYGIAEAKCPQSVYQEPPKAYWIQVQSQLHITNRLDGYLIAWTQEETAIWMTTRDEGYWSTVEPTLKLYWQMLKGDKPPGRTKKTQATLAFNWERIK